MAENFPQKLTALGVNYDPEVLASMFSSRRGELNSRVFVVAGTLGVFVSAVMRDWVTGQLERNYDRRGQQLASVLSGLGPAFVKLGQALSMRPDLLPKPYLEALEKLQVCVFQLRKHLESILFIQFCMISGRLYLLDYCVLRRWMESVLLHGSRVSSHERENMRRASLLYNPQLERWQHKRGYNVLRSYLGCLK